MTPIRRALPASTVLSCLAALALLAGCAVTGPAGPGDVPDQRDPIVIPVPDPSQEVWGLHNVIDDGSGPQLCPIVLESYPPQCGEAIPIDGWSWDGLQYDQEGEVKFGFFAVYGTFDGERLTVTLPPEFGGAIDMMPLPASGDLTPDEVAELARQLEEDLDGEYTLTEGDGQVLLDIVYDDGMIRHTLDERYGEGAVVVSAVLSIFDRA